MQAPSDPLAASASDVNRPSPANSSISDSQTLSRTRQAKAHYSRAAKAFLQRSYLSALVESQHAVNTLTTSSNLGLSLSSGNLADAEAELARITEKLAVLRFTLGSTATADAALRKDILSKLTQQAANPSSQRDAEAAKQLSSLLSRDPAKLIAHIWFEALRVCSQTHDDADVPSLEPTSETLHLAVELPSSVVSAAILAALRLDDSETRSTVGTQSARLIAEWYLAAYSSSLGPQGPTERAAAAYVKVVELYSLHILATRLDEWEYAREFVGYSSLDEHMKLALLSQLDAAHAHVLAKPDRVFEAEAAAQKAYEDEKARRAAAEKEAAATSSGAASKAQDLAKGVGDFLRRSASNGAGSGDDAPASNSAGSKSRSSGSQSRKSASGRHGDASSGSESGARGGGYFSSSRGSSPGSTSASTSPSVSPGPNAARPEAETSKSSKSSPSQRRPRGAERSSSRTGVTDGEASDGGASSSSRSRSRDAAAAPSSESHETSRGADKVTSDNTYAATRANLSRYVEATNGGGTSSSSISKASRALIPSGGRSNTAASRGAGAAGEGGGSTMLATLRRWLDVRNPQSRSYLLSAIVVLFIFYRAMRRPSFRLGGGGVGPNSNSGSAAVQTGGAKRRETAAARNARSRLHGRPDAASSPRVLAPFLFVWGKVVDTVKMGTQVTYL